ncbi:MAG: hydroxypyruvate isomerase family protein [Planctomycetota bacterium]
MIQFSVCIDMIFNDLPFEERMVRAAACGCSAVEFWEWQDKDLDVIARAKEAAGVAIAAFGGLTGKPAGNPDTAESTVEELLRSVEIARQVGAAGLIVVPGDELDGVPRQAQLDAVATVLAAASPAADAEHVNLLLEPVNRRVDYPAALLSTTDDAVRILDQVDQPNVKLLFDVYHQYVTERSVLHTIESHMDRIGHFHVADAPGRHEPGTGALDFREMFRLIDSLGYEGYVGLEFIPTGDHDAAVETVLDLV